MLAHLAAELQPICWGRGACASRLLVMLPRPSTAKASRQPCARWIVAASSHHHRFYQLASPSRRAGNGNGEAQDTGDLGASAAGLELPGVREGAGLWRELHRQYQRGRGPIMGCCAKSRLDSRPEKSREVVEHLLGLLLLDVMAALDRFVREDVGCIAPPHVEEVNCTLRCLPSGTPKQQEWHIELAILVNGVHFEIGSCARPVITA